jgi:2,4-dienoyl-CoA reductase-like NADH-dependent reductase (Old Yellow Enzyme family)
LTVHGANGYLVHQFLDSGSNKRTDEWGGSPENRSRFAVETLKAIAGVFGADRVGLKLNPAGGYNDVGMTLEETKETYSHLLSEANKLGLAYVVLARYTPMFDPTGRGTPHDVVETYGPIINRQKTKFFANTGYTPEEAEKVIAEGKADGVFLGVAWLTHPDLVRRVQHGKPLTNAPDFASLYVHDGTEEGLAKGYVDYPAATYDE